MKLSKYSEQDIATSLLEQVSTPTKLAQIGLSAGEWAGYVLGKPVGRYINASSADDIVSAIIDEALEPFTPEDFDESDLNFFDELMTKGFFTDHIEGAEYKATFWIIGEGWLDESLWQIYFSNLSEGLLKGALKAFDELNAEKAPNVVSLFSKRKG